MIIFLIGGLLCVLNHFKFEISTNQEYYMSHAKWWADPSWIPNTFLLSDAAGTRIGFNVMLYPFWKFFSYETLVMSTTFINLFIVGGLIFLIASEVRKPTIIFMVLIHLTLFSGLGDKSFYAGEWIFGGAEPKTFAYIFGLAGIIFYMRKQYIWTFLLVALGAYFHVLIAGWILVMLLLDSLFQDGIKPTIKRGIVFGLGILPLFLYLLSTYFQKGSNSYAGLDKIYIAQVHNHLKPWLVPGKEYRFYLGLSYAFIAAAISFYRMKKVDAKTAMIYRLSIYAFIVPAFLATLAPWEWFTPFLKAYPFRLTMMQKLLFFVAAAMDVSFKLESIKFRKQVTAGLIVILTVSGVLRINKNLVKRWGNYQDKDLLKVAEVIGSKFSPGTKVFYLDAATKVPDDKLDPLGRMARADVYFSNKIIPSEPEKMMEWYRRKQMTIAIQEDTSKISELKKDNIEVIVSKRELPLEKIAEVSEYKIYNFKL